MALPTIFGSLSGSIALSLLDTNFAAVGALGVLPNTVTGSNTLALTQTANTPTIGAFANYLVLSAITGATNTSAVTAALGTITARNVYKDTAFGPVTLSGGEMRSLNAMQLMFDSALNGGTGGFHYRGGAGAEIVGQTLVPTALAVVPPGTLGSLGTLNASLHAMLINQTTRQGTVTFTVLPANETQDSVFALPGCAAGDNLLITPTATVAVMGVGYTGFIAAAGTVTVRAYNVTAASIAAASLGGTFRITALRYSP